MDMKLEVVVIPVSDVDRAKRFYSEQVGFVVDNDVRMGESFVRLLQRPRRQRLGGAAGGRARLTGQ